MDNIIVMSDIHGCNSTLSKMLGSLPKNRKLVFLGDYIDRGNDSAGVIDTLIELKRMRDCVFLKGNHEDMFLNAMAGDHRDQDLFAINGGLATIKSYQSKGNSGKRFVWQDMEFYIPTEHLYFLYELQTHFETDTHIFVHAGLFPGISFEDNHDQNKLWIREDFLQSDYQWGKVVVHGHTPSKSIYKDHRRIGIDTGCVFGNKLTAHDVSNDITYSMYTEMEDIDRDPD